MSIEKAMNDLEMLALTKSNTASSYIATFTDIMSRLDLAGATLPMNHQIRKFIKGIMYPHYANVVNKIREIQQEGSKLTITNCYSRLRSEENWINEQSNKFSKMADQDEPMVQVGAMGRFEPKRKPDHDSNKMIGDKRWYFKDRNNVTAFFPPIPVTIWKELSRDSQRKMMEWRKNTMKECKARGMKDALGDLFTLRREKRKLNRVGIHEDDDYEDMALNFLGTEDGEEQVGDDFPEISFGRITVDGDMSKKVEDIENSGPQSKPITRNKREFLRMYSF